MKGTTEGEKNWGVVGYLGEFRPILRDPFGIRFLDLKHCDLSVLAYSTWKKTSLAADIVE